MNDQDILAIWHFIQHWLWGILTTGGGAGALLGWWLSKRKGNSSKASFYKALDSHKEEDLRKFETMDDRMTGFHTTQMEELYKLQSSQKWVEGYLKAKLP